MRTPAAIKIHGGKTYLADRIIGLMPPHTHYVEPFAGGLAVLLRKPCDGISEVVNDLDAELTTFWRVLQAEGTFERFRRRLEATPFSQVEFDQAGSETPNLDDSVGDQAGSKLLTLSKSAGDQVDRACRFFIQCRLSRQGLRKDFATLSRTRTRRGMNEQASAWWTAVDGLDWFYYRLRRVVILNADACRVIRQQDGPGTLFYCDPPYLPATRTVPNAYAIEMTTDDHAELLEVLTRCASRVILSGYPSPMYDAALRDWRYMDVEIDNKASGAATKRRMTERIWMNY